MEILSRIISGVGKFWMALAWLLALLVSSLISLPIVLIAKLIGFLKHSQVEIR